jgi:hypothetical protein
MKNMGPKSSEWLASVGPPPSLCDTSPKSVIISLNNLYGRDRWYTGVRGDSIRVNLLRIISPKTNLGNPLFEEKDIEDTLQLCSS